MMHKAWCSIEKVPYCFPRSSIKFQGHTGWKIDDLDQIWARLLGRSQLSNPSDLPCYLWRMKSKLCTTKIYYSLLQTMLGRDQSQTCFQCQKVCLQLRRHFSKSQAPLFHHLSICHSFPLDKWDIFENLGVHQPSWGCIPLPYQIRYDTTVKHSNSQNDMALMWNTMLLKAFCHWR